MHVLDRARLAAQTDADMLVEAESGTGKELLARFIHEASDRREKPFVAVNCAAVPEHASRKRTFWPCARSLHRGHMAKSGKFELANDGTLLLDEIGEMPLELQPKLLRVLQEREVERLGDTRTIPVNIRIIATTNVSLQGMVEQGRFRADLVLPAERDSADASATARATRTIFRFLPNTSPLSLQNRLADLRPSCIPTFWRG